MPPTEVFASYASEFRQQPLPAEVIHHAKRAVIDWYASLFPGLATAPCGCWRTRSPTISTAARRAWRADALPRRVPQP